MELALEFVGSLHDVPKSLEEEIYAKHKPEL